MKTQLSIRGKAAGRLAQAVKGMAFAGDPVPDRFVYDPSRSSVQRLLDSGVSRDRLLEIARADADISD